MIIQVGTGDPMLDMLGLMSPSALDFDPRTAYRDVFSAGDCDANVRELARLLGFGAHLPYVTTSACGTFLIWQLPRMAKYRDFVGALTVSPSNLPPTSMGDQPDPP